MIVPDAQNSSIAYIYEVAYKKASDRSLIATTQAEVVPDVGDRPSSCSDWLVTSVQFENQSIVCLCQFSPRRKA